MSSPSADMFLYWGSGSMPCMRPMIVLEEKGLSGYGNKLVEFSKNEHKGEDIMKLNPRGQVPTFRHGDIVVNESSAICHYLESQFKGLGTRLIPDEPAKQALVLQRMNETQNIMDKAGRDIFMYVRMNKDNIDNELLSKKKAALSDELVYWEGYIAGEFLCGNEFTMADVFLMTCLVFMVRCGMDLTSRPNLKKYYEKQITRPSVQASWPPHYKTSPPSELFVGV